jgi:hypothetical protein
VCGSEGGVLQARRTSTVATVASHSAAMPVRNPITKRYGLPQITWVPTNQVSLETSASAGWVDRDVKVV